MKAIIKTGIAKGDIQAPPSKSIAHRELICGALSGGSRISGIEYSEDIKATLRCLLNMGAKVTVHGGVIDIGGFDPFAERTIPVLDCGESGSTLRFLIPLCLLTGQEIRLIGSGRLMSRPLTIYEEICERNNFKFIKDKDTLTLCGRLKSGTYEIDGNISSQFISGLLFALPLLKEDSRLIIKGNFESASYVNLTVKVLEDFGIVIEREDDRSFLVHGNQKYKSKDICVEGDYSNAAFLDSFNEINGSVRVSGLSPDSLQGDRIYKEYFRLLNNESPVLDLEDCPDLAPILFALAAAKHGAVFTNTSRLRIKESDRGEAMKEELNKFGIPVMIKENSIIIENAPLHKPEETISGHNDHRIVMACAVLATLTGGEIEGAEAINKSYPSFFDDIKKLGIEVIYK